MTVQFGADPALVASRSSQSSLSRPSGFDPGEKWRPALIAFYERDELPQRARNLKNGEPLDSLDRRTIKALEAALIHAMVAA